MSPWPADVGEVLRLVAAATGVSEPLSLPPCVVEMTVMRVVMIVNTPTVSQKYRMLCAPGALAPSRLSVESASCVDGCVNLHPFVARWLALLRRRLIATTAHPGRGKRGLAPKRQGITWS